LTRGRNAARTLIATARTRFAAVQHPSSTIFPPLGRKPAIVPRNKATRRYGKLDIINRRAHDCDARLRTFTSGRLRAAVRNSAPIFESDDTTVPLKA
jgi:hypothetical protein